MEDKDTKLLIHTYIPSFHSCGSSPHIHLHIQCVHYENWENTVYCWARWHAVILFSIYLTFFLESYFICTLSLFDTDVIYPLGLGRVRVLWVTQSLQRESCSPTISCIWLPLVPLNILFYNYMYCLCVCEYSTCGGQRKASDLLVGDLQAFVSQQTGCWELDSLKEQGVLLTTRVSLQLLSPLRVRNKCLSLICSSACLNLLVLGSCPSIRPAGRQQVRLFLLILPNHLKKLAVLFSKSLNTKETSKLLHVLSTWILCVFVCSVCVWACICLVCVVRVYVWCVCVSGVCSVCVCLVSEVCVCAHMYVEVKGLCQLSSTATINLIFWVGLSLNQSRLID